uniref:cornifelin homolog B-like n=1 Tax=Scatophagus argus TaxID=75038 RepID=UPI001ED85456|nr:cornifelin homolog B-like [Scatophagus argus]
MDQFVQFTVSGVELSAGISALSVKTSAATGRPTQSSDAVMSSTMVIRQPQPVMVVQDSDEWGTGICQCLEDVPECCFAFWCLPCFACITTKKYGQCLCLPLLDMISGIPPVAMSMRVSMRQRYGIRGTMCTDCLYSTYCYSCSWCQMSREMKRRNIPIVLVGAKNT